MEKPQDGESTLDFPEGEDGAELCICLPRHEQAQVGAIPRGKDSSFVPQHQEEEKPHPCPGMWCPIHAQSISWHKEEQRNESTGTGEVQEGKDGTPGFLKGLSAEQGPVVKQKWEKKGKILQKNTKISTILVQRCVESPSFEKQVGSQLRNSGRKRRMETERQEVLDPARKTCWDFSRMGEQPHF